MITPTDIQSVIIDRLKDTFPGETVYEDLTPRDFTRPSNMVQLDAISSEQSGRNIIKLLYKFKITTFAEVDEIHNSHLAVLDFRSMMIVAAFAGEGYIRVADRAPAIVSCTADTTSYDFAEVVLAVSLTYDRSDFSPEESFRVMEDLALKTKTKEVSEHE